MNTQAFEILLLMTSLAQLRDKGRIVTIYIEGLNNIFPNNDFGWSEDPYPGIGGNVEVCTRSHKYGFVTYSGTLTADSTVLAMIHNSGQMIAVILEKLNQELVLIEQSKRYELIATERANLAEGLEQRVRERTADLEAAYRSLATSQEKLEQLNADLEMRVGQRTAEIERSRAAMESFSYTVSHDLRAPLRAIDGFVHIVLEDYGPVLPPDAKALLDRIAAGANRMGRLIEALLGLARLERYRIVLGNVDVDAMVAEVRDELVAGGATRRASPDGAELEWAIAALPPTTADPELVRQVFANLMGNACKFARTKPRPRIRVLAFERSDGIWYEVADNGIGFDMAYADKLFNVFQRLHGDSVEGIGIGLATVKKILDRFGGAIEADGHPGEGASFRFRLTPAMVVSETTRSETTKPVDPNTSSMAPLSWVKKAPPSTSSSSGSESGEVRS